MMLCSPNYFISCNVIYLHSAQFLLDFNKLDNMLIIINKNCLRLIGLCIKFK